ncbi:ATP-dependent DNA helicase UvrD2 [Brevibacterium sp. 91QC2O2]|uniref:ATP-dependent DNA helicase UvrD2 n=1 Tax=Brevibacterium TaxID=1696 RepID=UPI00211C0C40|nr:ATP-dependent DNA helicase UvrD2 [Brevibacterium sp. 91QC2O2]MCQ9384765.1 ATP-dependent DNA helicase UvrD2 [Brevibacterium sp. 68QC2CO]
MTQGHAPTEGLDPDALLAGLDAEQAQVATHTGGPLVVHAGAGTGKTRAMTHRIAYGAATGGLDPRHVLALTFTAKAAGEMRSRLRGLGVPMVQARTFHSAALRQLRYFWPRFAEGDFPQLITAKAGPVARAMAESGFEVERETVRDVAAEIEFAAVSLIGVEEYAAQAGHRELPEGIDAAAMVRIMTAYGELKSRGRLLDFEDVLLVLDGILGTREDIAAEIHQQYRHFVVDEFQDVSPLQFDLLMRWLGRRDSLCVVGDPAQTIYSFAGARDGFLLGLPNRLENVRTVSLVRNYRSCPPIVAAANRILAHTGRKPLVLQPVRSGGGPVRYTEYPDDEAEAMGVAEAVAGQIAAGRRAGDIAVLFRTNGQSRAFEEALSRRGISYVLRGGERFFARREVKEAIAVLRANQRSVPGTTPLSEAVRELVAGVGWTTSAPTAGGRVRERWESLSALVDLADEMQAEHELPVPLSAFVAELDDRREHQFAPAVDGVTLASVHAAKGLEWPVVYLVGLSEGLLPISYARSPGQIAEERRLFYVALTRARDEVELSWSLARQRSQVNRRRPSRFVQETRAPGPGSTGHTAPAPRPRARRELRCTNCNRVLDTPAQKALGRCEECAGPVDRAVFDRLVAWRAEQAEVERVPAYMVCTESTLELIARLRPTAQRELALVPGIGPVKLERYGTRLLEVLAG